jgi:hypothetical protein
MIRAIRVQQQLRMPFSVARRLILPQAQHTSSIQQSFGRGAVVHYRYGQLARDYP